MAQPVNITNGQPIEDGKPMPHNSFHDGGDGGGGEMADRLERLEKKVEAIDSTLLRLNESMIRLDSKIDLQSAKLTSALDLQSAKLTAALELQSHKLSSSLENQSISFDSKLKDQKIAIVFWVLTIPGALFGVIKLFELLASK